MKLMEETHPLSNFANAMPYFSEQSLLLDIETTGFDAKRQPIYLIGTAYRKEDALKVVLYFAKTPHEEAEILRAFLGQLAHYHEIITFNGEGFDIPYLQKRCEKYGIAAEALAAMTSIDLLRSIRTHKKVLHLDRCSQKSIEAYLGIEREDTYDGGQLIEVYRRYAKQPNEADESLLLQHNLDDVCGMVRILPMMGYAKLHDAALTPDTMDWDEEASLLTASFFMNVSLPAPVRIHEEAYYLILENSRVKAALPLFCGTLNYYFPYPAQYVYLLREGTVVPKVLGASIPASEKRPAKQEECFTAVNGDFLAIDGKLLRRFPRFFEGQRIFRKDYNKGTAYIKTDRATLQAQWLAGYVGLLLNAYF